MTSLETVPPVLVEHVEPEPELKHPIFTKDPSKCIDSIGKVVEILTKDGCTHSGIVYTVDPVSDSVVLVQEQQSGLLKMDVIMGHSLKSTSIISEGSDSLQQRLNDLFKPKTQGNLSGTALKQKHARLRSWLLKNRLPVSACTEDAAVLVVADVLRIPPPYDADSCQCTNEIVLGRIQGLIKNMPVEENPDI